MMRGNGDIYQRDKTIIRKEKQHVSKEQRLITRGENGALLLTPKQRGTFENGKWAFVDGKEAPIRFR